MNENQLFSISREWGSDYCMNFNENGYTDKYESFDAMKVRSEVLKRLTNEQLVRYVKKYNHKLQIFRNFYGQRYKFQRMWRKPTLSPQWEVIEKRLTSFLQLYGINGSAVLEAVYEANFEHGLTYKNYTAQYIHLRKTMAWEKDGETSCLNFNSWILSGADGGIR